MQAIILNSGKGSRLGDLTNDCPKGLIKLDQMTTLLSHQIDRLLEAGISQILITTGYLATQFHAYCQDRYPKVDIRFVHNEKFESTNYIVSLDRLHDIEFPDGVLLLHGDLVFSFDVLQDLMHTENSTVVVDTSAPIPQKDFKARIDACGRVSEIGIDVFGDGAVACQPLYRLSAHDWGKWQEAIRKFCSEGVTDVYAENALNVILNEMPLQAIDIKGRLCMEIDNKDDLRIVQALLIKRIK